MRKIKTQINTDLKHRFTQIICVNLYLLSVCICVSITAIPGYVFAETQIPTTAVVNVAPYGEYPPEIEARDQTVREDDTLEFDVIATDANINDIVTIEISQGHLPWLTIISNTSGNPATMRLRASPPMGTTGRFRVYFTATDNSPYLMSTTKDIYITVNPANQAPVIEVQNQIVQAGQLLTFTVNCYDPDNSDTLTLSYTGKPNWLTAIPSDNPVTGNPINITFTGTPQASDGGTHRMNFEAIDDGLPQQRTTKEITITVTTTENRPPLLAAIRNKEVPIRVKLEFAISATDPDGDPLTYSASGLPLNIGATFNPATQKFTWRPTNDQVGDYPMHFEVSDGTLMDSEDIIISVSSADAPVFDPFPYLTSPFIDMNTARIRVGETIRFAVTAKDPNDDPLTFSVGNVIPVGASFNPPTQTFTWTPQPGQEGTYQIRFAVSDGVYTTTKDLLIIVNPATAPKLKPVGEKHIRTGQLLSFALEATDPDTPLSQLTYSVSNNPSGSSLIGANFTWTPSSGQVGTYRDIIFTVSDGTSSDSSNCWIFVVPGTGPGINAAPVIDRIGEKHVVEGRTLAFTVNATDPDGDPITYLQPTNAPKGSYFDPVTHTFTWTPAIGERGIYNDIIFAVTDGVNTVTDNVWIFVAANDAPVIAPLFEQHIKAGKTLTFGISAYDPNGDTLIYKALNLPSGATFENQTFRWTPTLSQVGVYNDILFEVSDGVNIMTVRTWIFVHAPGAPVMERVGEKHITVGETLAFTVYATDPDNDLLTYYAENLPPGATFDAINRAFIWTPTADQVGTYPRVMFYVTDGEFTDSEDCWIFVKSASAPIIEVPGDQHIRAGKELVFAISATDPDTPLQNLVYSASNLPPGSTFSGQVFRWTPTIEQVGTYPDIMFTVSDGVYTDSKVIWIFVTHPGAPEFNQDITSKNARIGEPLTFAVSATDPDNRPEELTYYGVNLPQGATFSEQVFRWTPQPGQVGTYKDVRLIVKDPDNNIDEDIFWIFVTETGPSD